MRSSLPFIFCFLCISYILPGQSSRNAVQGDLLMELLEGGTSQNLRLEMDSLLTANYHKLMAQNSSVKGVPGYRIRIYSDSGLGAKEEQQRIRARFLSLYPEIDAYNRYDEPFFKVYVGDCRTRSEALKLFDEVIQNFRNPIIVEDHINLVMNE